MRRALAFFEWKTQWWHDQSSRRKGLPTMLRRGLASYANMQADVYQSLAVKFARLWLPYLQSQGITPTWADHYPQPTEPATSTAAPCDGGVDHPNEDGLDASDEDSELGDSEWGGDSSDASDNDYDSDSGEEGQEQTGKDDDLTQRQASVEQDLRFELGDDTL